MSATQFVVNDTASPLFVGGRMIPPGEGRDVPLLFLPAAYRAEAVPVAPAEPEAPGFVELLLELVRESVKHITAQLPTLTHEALDYLHELEAEAAHPRKTLLEAIAAEQLRRMSEAMDDTGTTDAERLAQSEAAFAAELDAQHAAQLDALSPEERAAVEAAAATSTPEGQG